MLPPDITRHFRKKSFQPFDSTAMNSETHNKDVEDKPRNKAKD